MERNKYMANNDDLKTIAQLLRNLLAIELWRGGLTQAEITERLGVGTDTVSKILKGVSKEVPTTTSGKE
jgi:transposase